VLKRREHKKTKLFIKILLRPVFGRTDNVHKINTIPVFTQEAIKTKKETFNASCLYKNFSSYFTTEVPLALHFSKSQLVIPMNLDDAEKILSNAVTLYAQENPEKKKEILDSLTLFQELTGTALTLASESNKSIQECLVLMAQCRKATLQTF